MDLLFPSLRVRFLDLPDLGRHLQELLMIGIEDCLDFGRVAALHTFEDFYVIAHDFERVVANVLDGSIYLRHRKPELRSDSLRRPCYEQIIENRKHRDARALDFRAAAAV